jgi:hypothetical protein
MRQSKWAPSIIPEDQTVYLVLDDFGHLGQAWRETDVKDAELEAVITDLLEGQYNNPVRVVGFNTAQGWARDVSEDVATELRRRCDLQMTEVPATLKEFVERNETQDRRQRTTSGVGRTVPPLKERDDETAACPKNQIRARCVVALRSEQKREKEPRCEHRGSGTFERTWTSTTPPPASRSL